MDFDEIIKQLESCDFECVGGPLRNNVAFRQLKDSLPPAIAKAKAALVGASNDAEHDALYLLVKALGYELPMCNCDQPEHEGQHAEDCPCKAWEKEVA